MIHSRLVLLVFVILVNVIECAQETESTKLFTDVLTLEMSFGDKDLQDEYLLANPRSVAVNSRNDIYVIDERRIKVFDETGKEKVILGNPGQGPGEFTGDGIITINSRGYFSVSNGGSFNYYDDQNNFINQVTQSNDNKLNKYLSENQIARSNLSKVFAFNEKEYFMEIFSPKGLVENRKMILTETSLLINSENTIQKIESAEKYFYIKGKLIPFMGEIKWDSLDDNRIVYTHTVKDFNRNNNEYEYVLHVFDQENNGSTSITRIFDPVEISGSDIDQELEYYVQNNEPEVIDFIKKQAGNLNNKYPAVRWLKSDGSIVFAGTSKLNESDEYLVEVFDVVDRQYIASFYSDIQIDYLKNGYAYRILKGKDIFPTIEKYKINLSVYR
ncbi:hypothetical protein IID62_06760 [candidate division KSB1 bacterium]|nr:hypothetical protein [candidate division KSB1 bacterium]